MRTSVVAAIVIGLAACSCAPAAAQMKPSFATDQVRAVYEPPKEAKHQPIYDALQERRILELLRALLSPFRLPRQLTLEVKGCDGSVDAYYGDDTATLCYEYIELIQQHSPKVGTPGGLARADAIVGAIIDTLLHEAGHAIIDMLEIPVLGREEDAADFFSAYILLQFPAEDAHRLIQGVGFLMASEAKAALGKPLNARTFANQHGLPAQRYYNLLCMAFGANSLAFADTVVRDSLPSERAEGCVEEYQMLQRAFKKLILPHVDEAKQRDALSQMTFNWKPLIKSKDGLDALPLIE
jgi:hypothetical protein